MSAQMATLRMAADATDLMNRINRCFSKIVVLGCLQNCSASPFFLIPTASGPFFPSSLGSPPFVSSFGSGWHKDTADNFDCTRKLLGNQKIKKCVEGEPGTLRPKTCFTRMPVGCYDKMGVNEKKKEINHVQNTLLIAELQSFCLPTEYCSSVSFTGALACVTVNRKINVFVIIH